MDKNPDFSHESCRSISVGHVVPISGGFSPVAIGNEEAWGANFLKRTSLLGPRNAGPTCQILSKSAKPFALQAR